MATWLEEVLSDIGLRQRTPDEEINRSLGQVPPPAPPPGFSPPVLPPSSAAGTAPARPPQLTGPDAERFQGIGQVPQPPARLRDQPAGMPGGTPQGDPILGFEMLGRAIAGSEQGPPVPQVGGPTPGFFSNLGPPDMTGPALSVLQGLGLVGSPPDVSREGSVNPMAPPQGGFEPLPVRPGAGNDLLGLLGMQPRPEAPSFTTEQLSGYEPGGTPPEASRQGGYGPAWMTRPPMPGGQRPAGGGSPPNGSTPSPSPSPAGSVGGRSPGPPASAPTPTPAGGQTAEAPPSARGDRFGISPRTYQLMGIIGATLLQGRRPGESGAGALGRAIGAGMMYDNFARLSDVEQAQSERALAVKEAQVGLEGQRVGQQGQLTAARIAQIRAGIDDDKRKLQFAANADERAALEHRIRTASALIGLPYIAPQAEADLAARRSQAETPELRRTKMVSDLINQSKDPMSGAIRWGDVTQRILTTPGLGFQEAPAQLLAAGRAGLAAKAPAEREAERERMNQALISKGYLPRL